MKRRIKWKNVVTAVALVLSLACAGWVIGSWAEVIVNNGTGNYSDANFWVLATGYEAD